MTFARNLTSVAIRSTNGLNNASRQQLSTRSSIFGRSLIQNSSRRMASSQSAPAQIKSDAPWAITSLLVFGGMFVYLTAPSAGGKHGDDHHGSKGGHGGGEKPAAAASKEDEDEDESDSDDEYVNVKKIEDKPGENAPRGSKALAERSLTADEGAHLQKPTKTGADIQKRPDDTTFKHGVAAAKEGHSDPEKRISDPKKVVAAAHTARQDKKAEEDSKKSSKKDEEEDGDDDDEDEE